MIRYLSFYHPLILVFFLSLCVNTLAWAEPGVDSDALAEQLARHTPQCGRFEQSRWLADIETQLNSHGDFQRLEEGLVWQTTSPIQDRVLLSRHNDDDLPPGFLVIAPVFTGLLSGEWRELEHFFSVELKGDLHDWKARLLPKEAVIAERLTQLLASGGQQVEQLTLEFTDGDQLDITLTPTACSDLDHGDSAS